MVHDVPMRSRVLDSAVRHQQPQFVRKAARVLASMRNPLREQREVIRMNPGANLLERDRGISRQLKNAIELVGEGDVVGVEAPGETAGRTDPLSVFEKRLTATKRVFRPPSLLHVRNQEIPTNGVAIRIHQWSTANLEPLIHTVEATQMVLHFERCAGLKRLLHGGDYQRQFIWWDDSAGLPAVQRLRGAAKELRHSAVYLPNVARRPQHRNLSRNAVNNQSSLLLAVPELFLRLFPVVDVDDAAVPFQDASVFVSQRKCRHDTPAIGMIRNTKRSDLDSICGTSGDARTPDWPHPRSIFWMDRLLPSGAGDVLRRDARVLQEAAVAVVDRAVGRRAPQHLRNRFRHLAQLAFARLDRALSPLPVFYVNIGAVPFDDGAGVIAQGIGANKKPPVCSVESPQPRLGGARVFGIPDPPPRSSQMVHICGVDGGRPAPPGGLLCEETDELQIVSIEELGGAVWTGGPDKRRN